MATCITCATVIERIGAEPITEQNGIDTWAREGTMTDDMLAGDIYCPEAPEGLHRPAPAFTVHMYIGTKLCHFDHECVARFRVGSLLVCGDHGLDVVFTAASEHSTRSVG